MRQVVTTKSGGYEVLSVQEAADPAAGPGELVIDVKAAGLNFADILARKGQYPDGPSKPCVMGYEVAGTVSALGDAVKDRSLLGRDVIAMTRFGGQAEQVVVTPSQLFAKPARLSFEEAAALPVNYLTAYVLLAVMGSLQANESVLIHNVGGGVGLAALDIARHIGATTFGTASRRKHAFLEDRGLDHVIDYRNNDWYEEVMHLTEGRGVELITDPLGGREWKRSYQALRSTGRLGMFGISTASNGSGLFKGAWNMLKTVLQMPFYHPLPLLNKNKGVFGVNIGHLWDEKEKGRLWMKNILEGVDEGWITPHVDAVFTFEEAAEAHRYIEERKNIGKVILVPS
ncbi:synaptic vesicle VAT-1 family membrane protein [Fodinibius sediminis]|uniref:NADPH:quinone reductase n=1 Tax=Fodinibius sediminis TaxID=1214077 RepID=A0A521BWU5_9BACT|nr:medium chain dehydrogenase/reductase family protein [Fodinibius sediminis]SMO51638.1 NADPH:quinone reductase [Fodinibius sediminis]